MIRTLLDYLQCVCGLQQVLNLCVCRDEGRQQVRVTKHGTGYLHYEMTIVSTYRVW